MGQVNYRELGTNGLAFDVDPAELPVGFVTDGQNVLPRVRGLINAPGYEDSGLKPGVEPEFLLAESNNGVNKIHVFGGTSSYVADGLTPVDTSNAGGYSSPVKWTAMYHKEVIYANNGVDPLQYYDVGDSEFKAVGGFPANLNFQYITSFKDFVIGLGVVEGSTIYNEEVYWAHPSIVGSTPPSWDVSDAAYDAGRQVFPTARGHIYNALTLGDYLVVYKSDSMWALSYIGGNQIFKRSLLTDKQGILCHGAVAAFPQGHFMVGEDSFYVYDGSGLPEKTGFGKVTDKFYKELDSDNFEKMFILPRLATTEIWIYYPSVGSEYCNRALVWNWQLDSWGFIDVDNVLHAVVSEDLSIGNAQTWEEMEDTTWEASGRWTEQVNRQFVPVLYEAHYQESGIGNLTHQIDNGLREGAIASWFVERADFLLGPFSARGNVIQTYETVKIVSEIWIRMISNGTFYVYVGGRDNESDEIEWEDPIEFDPSIDEKVDVFVAYRFHALRIENKDASSILLQGINVRWEDAGDF